MQAVRFHEYGGPDVITFGAVEPRTPGEDEIRIAVQANSVNPTDTHARSGSTRQVPLLRIPGSDFADVVKSVGSDAEDYCPGIRHRAVP